MFVRAAGSSTRAVSAAPYKRAVFDGTNRFYDEIEKVSSVDNVTKIIRLVSVDTVWHRISPEQSRVIEFTDSNHFKSLIVRKQSRASILGRGL